MRRVQNIGQVTRIFLFVSRFWNKELIAALVTPDVSNNFHSAWRFSPNPKRRNGRRNLMQISQTKLNLAALLSVGLRDACRSELTQPLPDPFLELLKRLEEVVSDGTKVDTEDGVSSEMSRRSSDWFNRS